MVTGWMSRVDSRQAAIRAAKTIVKRCHDVHMMRPAIFRSATMSCCRGSAFSATNFQTTAHEIRGQPGNEPKKVEHLSSLTPSTPGWNL